MTAVVTLLVNDPVTREQRNTTVAVLGKGSSFGVSQYFCYLRKCPVNTMDQARCFTVHACLSASISFNIVRVSFSVLRWHHIQYRLSIFSILQELALLHHKTRSATVLCKDEVSLLAVCREVRCMVVSNVSDLFSLHKERLHISKSWYPLYLQDFRDIFMSYEDGREPEHIRFLK